MRVGSWVVVVASAMLVTPLGGLGCGSPSHARSEAGAIELVASGSEALASDVAKVTLTISGDGIVTPIVNDLTRVGGKWTGVVAGIPAGVERTIHADAYGIANALLYRGEVQHVQIDAGATSVVSLLLQQASAPTPFTNSVPLVDAFVVSRNAITPGQTVSLAVTAHDPDAGDALTYAWSGTGGAFASAGSATTTWTAPATEGSQTLTIKATDPKGAVAAMSVTIGVAGSNAVGITSTTVDFNDWPTVTSVIPSPTRIDAGQSTALTVVASDTDGDPLAYAWASSCGGSFSNATAQNPTFALGAKVSGPSCTLTVTATDGRGGKTTGAVTVQTGPGVAVTLPPQIDGTFQSSLTARAGDVLTFKVRAHDPQNGALTYAWSATAGTLGAQSDVSGESTITWTAPAACNTSMTITATIKDAGGLTAAQPFNVATDTATDPSNCGTCGNDCGGFACKAGACQLTQGWKLTGSGLASIAAADAYVWGLDTKTGTVGNAYAWNGTTFVQRNQGRYLVTVGNNGEAWALGNGDAGPNSVFHWNKFTFAQEAGTLTEVAVGADESNVWGLNGTSVLHWDGSAFQPVAGALAHVAVGGTAVFGTTATGAAQRWNGTAFVDAGAALTTGPTGLVVGQNGVAWGIDASGKATYWDGTAFQPTAQTLTRVAAGNDGTVWGLNGGAAYAWNGTAFEARAAAPLGTLTDVAVGRADAVWAIDSAAKRVFRWGACVAPGQWSGSADVCCSTVWASPNTCG